jgi:plastocyanin
MNAYVIAGSAFAVFAVLISLAGMRGFPSSRGGQLAAMGLAGVLFVVAVGSAIGDTTKVGERKGAEPKEEKAAPEGGGGQAPAAPAQPSAPQTSAPAPPPAGGGGGETDLALAADPTGQLKFDKATLDAKAGQVKITLTNKSPVPHNIAIKGPATAGPSDNAVGGSTASVTADLKPGTYEFYCAIPGHEQAGMKGTLTVK